MGTFLKKKTLKQGNNQKSSEQSQMDYYNLQVSQLNISNKVVKLKLAHLLIKNMGCEMFCNVLNCWSMS